MASDENVWMYVSFGLIGFSGLLLVLLAIIGCAYCWHKGRQGLRDLMKDNQIPAIGELDGEEDEEGSKLGLKSFLEEPVRHGSFRQPLSERRAPSGAASPDKDKNKTEYPIVVDQAQLAVACTNPAAAQKMLDDNHRSMTSSSLISEATLKVHTPEGQRKEAGLRALSAPRPSRTHLHDGTGGNHLSGLEIPAFSYQSDRSSPDIARCLQLPANIGNSRQHADNVVGVGSAAGLKTWNEEDDDGHMSVFASPDKPTKDDLHPGDGYARRNFNGVSPSNSPRLNSRSKPETPTTPRTHARQKAMTSSQLEEILPGPTSRAPDAPLASSTPKKPFTKFGKRRTMSVNDENILNGEGRNNDFGNIASSQRDRIASLPIVETLSSEQQKKQPPRSPRADRPALLRSNTSFQTQALSRSPHPHRARSGSLSAANANGELSPAQRRRLVTAPFSQHSSAVKEEDEGVEGLSASNLLERLSFRGEKDSPFPRPPVSKAPSLQDDFVTKVMGKQEVKRGAGGARTRLMSDKPERRNPNSAPPRKPDPLPSEPIATATDPVHHRGNPQVASPFASITSEDSIENPYMMPKDEPGGVFEDPIYEKIRSRRVSLKEKSRTEEECRPDHTKLSHGRSDSSQTSNMSGGPSTESPERSSAKPGSGNPYRASTLYHEVAISENRVMILDRIGTSNA